MIAVKGVYIVIFLLLLASFFNCFYYYLCYNYKINKVSKGSH